MRGDSDKTIKQYVCANCTKYFFDDFVLCNIFLFLYVMFFEIDELISLLFCSCKYILKINSHIIESVDHIDINSLCC